MLYKWRAKFGSMNFSEARRLRELEAKNAKLKHLLAEAHLDLPPEVWKLGLAPFIRRAEEGSGNKVIEACQFGLMPGFAKEPAYGRRTYNARSGTVDQQVSFKDSRLEGRRCIAPAECIFEPCYESGKAVRWRIQLTTY